MLKSTSALITKSMIPKSLRNGRKSPKKRLANLRSHTRSHKSSHKSSASKSDSGSYERKISGSPMSKLKTINKNITKKYKKLGIDEQSVDILAKKVNSLDRMTKTTFAKTKKKKTNSPLVLTVKNLDTGKKQEATIVKNLNTGKYEFFNL